MNDPRDQIGGGGFPRLFSVYMVTIQNIPISERTKKF